jgi:hypothetical protein
VGDATIARPAELAVIAPLRKRHLGWNPVVADFSVPHPSYIAANLKPGTGPHEKWYFFTATAP